MISLARLIGKHIYVRAELIQGYCLKCKSRRGIKNPNQVRTKDGRPRTKGSCVVCSSRMSTLAKA